MLALLALSLPARAEDVIVPEPTVTDVGDIGVAFLTYGLFVDALREGGVDVVDGDVLRNWQVPGMQDCASNASCPGNYWAATDARIAVVLKMEREGGAYQITARLHSAEDAEAFKVYTDTVPGGTEGAWAVKLARNVRDALPLVGTRTIADPGLRTPNKPTPRPRPVAEEPAPLEPEVDLDEPVEPLPRAEPRERKAPSVVAPEDRSRGTGGAERLERMHLPRYVRDRFATSGQDVDTFLARQRVRGGQVVLEVHGGAGFGDVHRAYGVQLAVEPNGNAFTTLGTSTWEGAGGGSGPAGAIAIGYSPVWWLDTSVMVGAQVGFKRLVAGWECEPGLCDTPTSTFEPEPVRAAQVLIEPRLRLWPVATGVVKPYALAGFTTMLHDGIDVPDSTAIDYPNSAAGAVLGITGGGGLALDVNDFFTLQLEVPFTWMLPEGPQERIDPLVKTAPNTVGQYGYLLRGTGAIAVRF